MADVADTLAEWLSTTASNAPTGATTIGTGLDDNLREIQGVVVRGLSHKGSDIASAGTMDVGAVEGLMHDITGTTTVTGLGTVRAGIWKVLKYEGAVPVIHNATSLILLGGANRTMASGDTQIVISEGSGNWRELSYFAAGNGPTKELRAEQATTSGTAWDFTDIPAWAKKITVQFVGFSTNGTSVPLIQLGDSGGVESTGYTSVGTQVDAAPDSASSTAGFVLNSVWAATYAVHGAVVLTLQKSSTNLWVANGHLTTSTPLSMLSSGSRALDSALTTVRLTMTNGTDAGDAGAVSILIE